MAAMYLDEARRSRDQLSSQWYIHLGMLPYSSSANVVTETRVLYIAESLDL